MERTAAIRGLTQTEEQFQQAVIDLAKALGWLTYHPHDSRRSTAGYPDLTLVRGERLIFAELKSTTGHLSPAQRVWLAALADAGQTVRVWRTEDWREIETELRRCR